MRILHISLCGPVTDNFSYQDNLLPKYHKKMGYEVTMITSKFVWNAEGNIDIDSRDQYYNEFGVKTIRLKNIHGTTINSKFKRYSGLFEKIVSENPDIIFIHGVQFLDIRHIVRYLKKNLHVKVYVDNHADFSNSATNWLSKNILHKFFWKKSAQLIEPYANKFYGVLPARVDFLNEIYGIPKEKIELLVMGADDEKVEQANTKVSKIKIQNDLRINTKDFIIVTGGKIDRAKRQVMNLMKAINKLNNPKVKLIVYGSVIPEMKEEVYQLAENDSIEYIGWINDDQSYKLFSIADLVVFPGRHSVYWEQVVAQGVPMIVKYWNGTTHIDIGGNCQFLYQDSTEEITKLLKEIIENNNVYEEMLKKATTNDKEQFLYSNIALKSLELEL